jgi:CRP/FNR family transcriptional regulator, dissimilatory nitrate respiration regulator
MHKNIENCILFKGLNSFQVEELLDSVSFREKKYSKNDIVVHSDDEVRDLLIIVDGSVRGEMVDFTGKTIKIEDIESPRMLAPAFLFGMNNRYPVDIVANEDSAILSISKDSFLKLLQTNKLVLTNYLNSISNRAQFLSNKIKFLSFQTIKGKIAHFLLQIRQKTGKEEFILPKSQNELAEMFGVARPSLTRAMREIHDDGIISAEGKEIKILDKNRLSALLRN